jgi:hypothetical protein
MKIDLQRRLLAAAAATALALAATAANAAQPPQDPAPNGVVTQGAYAVDTGNGGNINNSNQTLGSGAFVQTLGGSNAGVNIGVNLSSPAAYASGTAVAGERGQLQGSASITYLVDLHANSQAAADQILSRLNGFGTIATVSGSYSNSVSGEAYAFGNISTGVFLLDDLDFDPAKGDGRIFSCDPGNIFPGGTNGCGSGSFSGVALNFVTSTNFVGGSSLDFYADIQISASGGVGPGGSSDQTLGGGFSAFMDPTISFGAGLNPDDFTLTLGDGAVGGGAGGVPEPASWALMIAGFGLTGAALRRRRAALA